MKKIEICLSEWVLIKLILLSTLAVLFITITIVKSISHYEHIIVQKDIEIACYRDHYENCKDQLGVFYNPKEMFAVKGE